MRFQFNSRTYEVPTCRWAYWWWRRRWTWWSCSTGSPHPGPGQDSQHIPKKKNHYCTYFGLMLLLTILNVLILILLIFLGWLIYLSVFLVSLFQLLRSYGQSLFVYRFYWRYSKNHLFNMLQKVVCSFYCGVYCVSRK